MITFQTSGVDMPKIDLKKISEWISLVAASHNRKVGNVNYCFCDDSEILRNNRQFLGHDYFTDVITFDYSRHLRVSGDILISLDTVASNARALHVPYDRELLRVIIHGILHLCGIDDKAPGQREIMESAENKALDIYDHTL